MGNKRGSLDSQNRPVAKVLVVVLKRRLSRKPFSEGKVVFSLAPVKAVLRAPLGSRKEF